MFDTIDASVIKSLLPYLAPLLIPVIFYAFRRVYLAFQALHLLEDARKTVAQVTRDGKTTEGPGFWLKKPIRRPANYAELRGSIPILMIAATKGGVGKTSLTSSLAAYFATKWTTQRQLPGADQPLRVLVIDQDFQGSFTTMTTHLNNRGLLPSKANRLVSGELGNGGVFQVAEAITQDGMTPLPSIKTISADYDLAQAENRKLIEWLLPLSDKGLVTWLLRTFKISNPEPKSKNADIRYLLAEALLDPSVQTNFDLVIIDAPPRLTTSHIQAMCASTHLLIPTVLDALSGDAVYRYLDQIATHKLGAVGDDSRIICPDLEPIGVVSTIIPPGAVNHEGALGLLRQRIAAGRLKPEIVPEDCFIKQRAPYRDHAGLRIAYAAVSGNQAHEALRDEVNRLGDWVSHRLRARGWKRKP
jgi:chromosome partitioning protein